MLNLKKMRFLVTICLFLLPLLSSQAGESSVQNLLKDQARIYREQGYKLQSMGDLGGALIYYQKAAELDPNSAQVRNDLGVVYEAMGDEEKALKMYEEALRIDPAYLSPYTNLAFLYERRGDIAKATNYWKKRYELGQKGEYWWEVSRQHLLKLGTYPQVRKEILEEKAGQLSKELISKREQQRLKLNEEAKLRFDIGKRAFIEGNYSLAMRESGEVLSLNPPDEKLKSEATKLYSEAERFYLKQQALANTKDALEYMNNGDYLSAGERLKKALEAVFHIAQ